MRRKERAPKRASSAPTYDELTYVLLYLPKVPIFSGCSQEQLARVSGFATVRNLDDGEVVVREGEPGDEFYVVLTGGATVTRGGDVVAKLQPRYQSAPPDSTMYKPLALPLICVTLLTPASFTAESFGFVSHIHTVPLRLSAMLE